MFLCRIYNMALLEIRMSCRLSLQACSNVTLEDMSQCLANAVYLALIIR